MHTVCARADGSGWRDGKTTWRTPGIIWASDGIPCDMVTRTGGHQTHGINTSMAVAAPHRILLSKLPGNGAALKALYRAVYCSPPCHATPRADPKQRCAAARLHALAAARVRVAREASISRARRGYSAGTPSGYVSCTHSAGVFHGYSGYSMGSDGHRESARRPHRRYDRRIRRPRRRSRPPRTYDETNIEAHSHVGLFPLRPIPT